MVNLKHRTYIAEMAKDDENVKCVHFLWQIWKEKKKKKNTQTKL